jgi:hypothetical protein
VSHFGARALLAALALGLVAVPFGLLLFLVEDKWSPLLDVDSGATRCTASRSTTPAS